jgi:hypothetical protein
MRESLAAATKNPMRRQVCLFIILRYKIRSLMNKLLLCLLFTMPSLLAQTKTLFYERTIPTRFVIL